MKSLALVEAIYLAIVLVGAPLYARMSAEGLPNDNRKALNLPDGSIRAMLALMIVGSFVIVLVLGQEAIGDDFDTVITAFGTLTGAVVGFYFGAQK